MIGLVKRPNMSVKFQCNVIYVSHTTAGQVVLSEEAFFYQAERSLENCKKKRKKKRLRLTSPIMKYRVTLFVSGQMVLAPRGYTLNSTNEPSQEPTTGRV